MDIKRDFRIKPKTAFVLLALLILAPFVYATATTGVTTLRTIPWELMVAAAIFAAYGVVALAYMISAGLSIPELKGWATNEAYQITAILILVLFVFVISRMENSLFESFGFMPTPLQPNPAIESSKTFLNSSREYLLSVASSGYIMNALSIAATKKVAIPLGIFGKLKDPFEQSYRSMKDMIGIAVGGVQISIGLITAQEWFLDLIARTAFTIFLPIGILLRTFTFSRGIGAFFIAIAVSFYLVYPLTFLMDQKIMDTILCHSNDKCQDGAWKDIREARLPTLSAITDRVGIDNAFGELAGGIATGIVGSASILLRETAFSFITFTMLTILNFVVTAGVTRSIANLMGYDIRIGDLIKVL